MYSTGCVITGLCHTNVKYSPRAGIVPGGQSGHHFLLLSILKIGRQSESIKNYSYPLQ